MTVATLGYNLKQILASARNDPPQDPFAPEPTFTDEQIQAAIPQFLRLNNSTTQSSFVKNLKFSVLGEDHTKEDLKAVHTLFEQHIEEIKPHLFTYHNYLRAASRGMPLSDPSVNLTDSMISEATHAIQTYHLETSPFLDAARTIPRVRAIFRKYFCPKCYLVHGRVRQFFNIISLHARLGDYIPCKLIVDIAFNCLDNGDMYKVYNFVQLLVEKQVETKILYLGLKALVQNANNYLTNKSDVQFNNAPQLGRVIDVLHQAKKTLADNNRLVRTGHPLFNQVDEEFAAWRSSLKSGSILSTTLYEQTVEPGTGEKRNQELVRHTLEIHTFVLDVQMGQRREGKNEKCVYVIGKHNITKRSYLAGEETFDDVLETVDNSPQNLQIDHPSKVICVGHNTAWMDCIESQRRRHVGVHLPRLLLMDPAGKFAVVERLREAFGGADWDKDKKNPETKRVIIGYLKHLCTQPTIPAFLSPKYIMLNNQGALRTFKRVFGRPFALQPLEQFALDLAANDQALFQEFIQESGLNNHRHAHYLRKAILATFDKPGLDLQRLGEESLKEEDDSKALAAQAANLQNKMKFMYEECLKFIEFKTATTLIPAQKERIKTTLLNHYKKSVAVTIWPPRLKENVTSACM